MENKQPKIYNRIHMIKLNIIKPYFNNPRNNDKSTAALAKIIPEVGFNVPLVIDKNFVIIKGHSRYHAAKLLKMEKVPCIISENDDKQNNADRVYDNAINDLSEWNNERLIHELRETGLTYKDLFDFHSDFIDFDNKLKDKDFFYSKETKRGESLLTINCPTCGEEILLSPVELTRKIEINKKMEENIAKMAKNDEK